MSKARGRREGGAPPPRVAIHAPRRDHLVLERLLTGLGFTTERIPSLDAALDFCRTGAGVLLLEPHSWPPSFVQGLFSQLKQGTKVQVVGVMEPETRSLYFSGIPRSMDVLAPGGPRRLALSVGAAYVRRCMETVEIGGKEELDEKWLEILRRMMDS